MQNIDEMNRLDEIQSMQEQLIDLSPEKLAHLLAKLDDHKGIPLHLVFEKIRLEKYINYHKKPYSDSFPMGLVKPSDTCPALEKLNAIFDRYAPIKDIQTAMSIEDKLEVICLLEKQTLSPTSLFLEGFDELAFDGEGSFGADVEDQGTTLLTLAVVKLPELAHLLLKYYDPTKEEDLEHRSSNRLSNAMLHNDYELAKYFIDHGANMHYQFSNIIFDRCIDMTNACFAYFKCETIFNYMCEKNPDLWFQLSPNIIIGPAYFLNSHPCKLVQLLEWGYDPKFLCYDHLAKKVDHQNYLDTENLWEIMTPLAQIFCSHKYYSKKESEVKRKNEYFVNILSLILAGDTFIYSSQLYEWFFSGSFGESTISEQLDYLYVLSNCYEFKNFSKDFKKDVRHLIKDLYENLKQENISLTNKCVNYLNHETYFFKKSICTAKLSTDLSARLNVCPLSGKAFIVLLYNALFYNQKESPLLRFSYLYEKITALLFNLRTFYPQTFLQLKKELNTFNLMKEVIDEERSPKYAKL